MDNPIKYSDLISPDSSITDLINQLQQLANQYASNIAQIKQGAQDLANSLRNVNGATEQGREKTKQAATEVEKLAQQHRKLAEAEDGTHKEMMRLKQATKEANDIARLEVKIANSKEGSYNRLSAQYSLLKIKLNQMSEAERKNTKDGRDMEAQAKRIYEQMKKLQEATGKHQLNVGNYYEGVSQAFKDWGNQLPGIIGGNNQLFKSFMSLGSSMNGTTSIMGGLSAGLKALGSTLMSLMANPVFLAVAGVAAVGMGVKWWYDYNAGIQEATRLTREFTGMVGDELVDFRSEVLAISDTWGKEYKETLQAIDAVQANFGISFREAAEAVKDGFQAGADLNGDFLSKLQQYPASFREAGVSVKQFVAILTQTRSGIFGDKGLDAIKQANARLREMNKSTADALDAIGINSHKVTEDLATGMRSTFDVLQEVSAKLAELPPASQEVGNVLMDVFGKQGRDAGLEMIKSLADINTNLDEVKKGTGELGELEAQQADAEKELQVALAALFDQTGGNFERMKANLSIFVKKALTSLIKGFINLTNYIIDAYNKSAAFRAVWAGIAALVTAQFKLIANVLNAFKDLLVGLGKALVGVFTLDLDELWEGVKQFSLALPKMMARQVRDTSQIIMNSFDTIAHGHIDPIKIPVEFTDENGYQIGDNVLKAVNAAHNISNHKSRNASSDSGSNNGNGSGNRTTASTTRKSPATKSGARTKASRGSGSGRTVDPVKAMEEEFKAQWRLYQENLRQRRQYEDSQLVLIESAEEREKKVAKYKFDRQIQDLVDTRNYWAKLHQLNAKNQWTPEQDKWINDRITSLQLERTEALLNIERKYMIERNQVEKEGNEMLLKTMKEGSAEQLELRKRNLELERQTALMQDAMKPLAEQIGASTINKMYDAELANLMDEYTQHQLELYDKEQEYYQSEFDLLQKSEKSKTKYRLQAEKERLQKVLELNEQMNNKMSDVEVQAIKNQIAKIDKDIKALPNNDIYDMLGLELGDEQKQAIDQSLQYATEALDTFMNSYVQAAEAKARLAQQDVDNAKKVLESEIEARNQGYASDVATGQKELDLARKQQEKAQRQQEKAQRAQAAVQAAEQIGNLVTASSLIWRQLGFPWAIPALAVMWGSFAYSRIKAAQAVGSETYGEGTVQLLSGGSHQSGNDIDLGTTPDGRRRRAEGGEFFAVINKRNSRRYRKVIPDVIRSLNDGSFAGKYLNAYKTDDGLLVNVTQSPAELKSLSSDVSAIRKAHERKMYADGRGNVIEVYKNVKRTTKG